MASRNMSNPLFHIAIIVSLLAFCCLYLSLLWVSRLPGPLQAALGMVVGVAVMASQSIMQMQRSHHRKFKGMSIAQVLSADARALRKLLSSKPPSWVPDPSEAGRVRWINVGLCEIWPFFKEASSGILKLRLQAVLEQYKFATIQEISIAKIDLGKNCPFIQGIQPLDSIENGTGLEVQIDWRQNQDQEMVLNVVTSGPEYIVQVRHFVIYAVLKLIFTPLKDELPGFAAVIVSITEPPLIDFQTKFLQGDIKQMPELEKAVDNMLLAALMDLVVWPNRILVPFIPGDYSHLKVRPTGQLHVQLLEAKELKNKEVTGHCDPYVLLFVRRRQDLIKESSRMQVSLEPVWNESFVLNVEDPEVQKLTIKMMNEDETTSDVYIGTAELALNQLDMNICNDIWIDLAGDPAKLHGKCAGKVHLLVEYKPGCADESIKTEVHEENLSVEECENYLHTEITEGQSQDHTEVCKVNNTGIENHTNGRNQVFQEECGVTQFVGENTTQVFTRDVRIVTEEYPHVESETVEADKASYMSNGAQQEQLTLMEDSRRSQSSRELPRNPSRNSSDVDELPKIQIVGTQNPECEPDIVSSEAKAKVGEVSDAMMVYESSHEDKHSTTGSDKKMHAVGSQDFQTEEGYANQLNDTAGIDTKVQAIGSQDFQTKENNVNQLNNTAAIPSGNTYGFVDSCVITPEMLASEIFEVD